jgi:hypothetical protein
MVDVKLELNEKQRGAFILYETGAKIGEMIVDIVGTTLTVYHTEVAPAAEGKGYAKQLLHTMVAYAREHKLTVLPLCPYVLAQFRRTPDEYLDIWNGQTGR